jgi:hypothetical protein
MEQWIKTYTYEEYNEIEIELELLKMSHEKNYDTYIEALTKINDLENEVKFHKWDSFIKGIIAGVGITILIYSLTFLK